jgi:hypothetical protein
VVCSLGSIQSCPPRPLVHSVIPPVPICLVWSILRFRRVPSCPSFFPPLQALVTEVNLPRCVVCRCCVQIPEFSRESTTPGEAVRAQREQNNHIRQVNEYNGTKAGDRRFRLHCRRVPFCRISLPFPRLFSHAPTVSLRSIINPPGTQAPTRSFQPNGKLQTLKSRRALTPSRLLLQLRIAFPYDDERLFPSVRFRFRAAVPGNPSSCCPSLFFCSSSLFIFFYLFFSFFFSEIFLLCPSSFSHYPHCRVYPLVRIDFPVPDPIPHHGFREHQDQGQEPSGGTGR